MKDYSKPELREFGRVDQITKGSGTLAPDGHLVGGSFIANNTNCTDPAAVLCVVS